MKKLRKPYVALLLALLMLYASCESNSIIEQNPIISKYSSQEIFEGLFFLNNEFADELEVVSNSTLYNELKKYPNAQKGIKDAGDLMMKMIQDNDPAFFEKFGNLIKSGDEYLVKEAISIGTEKVISTTNLLLEENGITQEELSNYIMDNELNDFIGKDGKIDKEKLKIHLESIENQGYNAETNSMANQGRCIVAGIFFVAGAVILLGAAVLVVAAVNGGVLINLAAAVFGWVEIAIHNDDQEIKSSNNLAYEMLINQIASISRN